MNYVGVDIHKKYSVLCALDERGGKLGLVGSVWACPDFSDSEIGLIS